jgi:hypothetical protein
MRGSDVWQPLWLPALVSIIAGLLLYPLTQAQLPLRPVASAPMDFLLYMSAYLGGFLILSVGRRRLREVFDLVREMKVSRRQRGS